MAAAPYVLARSIKEAHDFARGDLGLAHGSYRIVNTPSTLKSVRGADLYLVPGWQNRFDRFAMKGAIRWTRMNVIDVTEQHKDAAPDDLTPPGVQLSIVTAEEAEAFFAPPEEIAEPDTEIDDDSDQAEESGVKRRRSRCSDCGTLHFKEDPCPPESMLEGV